MIRSTKQRPLRRFILIVVALSAGLSASYRLSAQDNSVLTDVGSLKADPQTGAWPDWSFQADVDIGDGNWTALNVVNTTCFIGTDDPRAGAANAGAIAWYAQLLPAPGPLGYVVLGGTLNPVEGTSATGTVTITTHPGVDSYTLVNVRIPNLDDSAKDDTFKVCIAGG